MDSDSLPSPTMHRLRTGIVLAALIAVLATAASARAGGSTPLSPQTIRYWTAIASCETGGGGPPKWDWGSKHRPGEGTVFEGGLGFAATVWQSWATELGLAKLYPHAYNAPPLVQMRVAEYGVKMHGARWGCSP